MKNQSSLLDNIITQISGAVRTIAMPATASRPSPAATISEPDNLNSDERQLAVKLMRVNHCGEVCAQALYQGQAIFARDPEVRKSLQEAADEEIDHLAWTAERIHALDGKQSILNPVWYAGSFALGAAAALISDKVSLGTFRLWYLTRPLSESSCNMYGRKYLS